MVIDGDVWLISRITEWDCQLQAKDWYHRQEPACEVTSNIYSWKVNQQRQKATKNRCKRNTKRWKRLERGATWQQRHTNNYKETKWQHIDNKMTNKSCKTTSQRCKNDFKGGVIWQQLSATTTTTQNGYSYITTTKRCKMTIEDHKTTTKGHKTTSEKCKMSDTKRLSLSILVWVWAPSSALSLHLGHLSVYFEVTNSSFLFILYDTGRYNIVYLAFITLHKQCNYH